MKIELRPWQSEAIEQLRDGIRRGHRAQMLVAPTGAGKSYLAANLLEEAYKKQSRVAFICDRIVLVNQFCDDYLVPMGIPHGVLQSGHWRFRPYERVQVCSAQTIERRGLPDQDLIIVDEAHCQRASVTELVRETKARVIGLTATPFSKGLGESYSNMVNVTTTNRLIDEGVLVPLKVYVAKAADMTGAKVVAGEWSDSEIEKRGNEIIGDIVAEWQAKTQMHFGGPVKTIVFSATVKHGEELCRQFQAAGFNFQQVSYKTCTDDERKALIERFKEPGSDIHGLVSCEILTKGFDARDVLCGISARPYRKSFSSHIQQLGRVMRSSEGKTYGLWLDHSGNYMRFYQETVELFEDGVKSLDAGEKDSRVRNEPEKKQAQEIVCQCGYVMAPWTKKCPSCGKERVVLSMVETIPGEMIEVDADALTPAYLRDRAYVWDQLCSYAMLKKQDHESARRFCAAKWKSWYGHFPNRSYSPPALITPLSPGLARRIQADNIRWAKSQTRSRAA